MLLPINTAGVSVYTLLRAAKLVNVALRKELIEDAAKLVKVAVERQLIENAVKRLSSAGR
jgi:hypothetical protein